MAKWNWEQNMSNSAVSINPADGLAPLGARASTGTVITTCGSRIGVPPGLKSYNYPSSHEAHVGTKPREAAISKERKWGECSG